MKIPHDMTTLSQVMNSQREKGFTEDFEFRDNKFLIKNQNKEYDASDLTIVQTFRFEGISDPAYMEILYSIESKDGTKGLFVDAFGNYGTQGSEDPMQLAEFIKNMNINENHSKN